MRQVLAITVFLFGLSVAPVSAEESPADLLTNLRNLNADEILRYGKLWERTNGAQGLPACTALLQLAYDYFQVGVTDIDKALDLALKTPLAECEVKDVIVADLQYGESGSEPDHEIYELLVEKTAIYLFYVGGAYYFSPSDSEVAPFSAASFERQLGTFGEAAGTRAVSLARTLRDVLKARPKIVDLMDSDDRCGKLKKAVAHLNGFSNSRRDTELGEMLLWAARHRPEPEENLPDIDYAMAKYAMGFELFTGVRDFGMLYLEEAASEGHPEASLELALTNQKLGDIREAQFFFDLAARGGISAASMLMNESIRAYGDLRDEIDRTLAADASRDYQRHACRD